MLLEIDAYPLAIMRFPRLIDELCFDAMRAAQARLYARGERYVSFVDMRGTKVMPAATIRRSLAEWTKENEPRLRELQIANAMVVDSPLTRAGIQAVHWFAPPPVPTAVTGSFAEGARFLMAQARLGRESLSLCAWQRLSELESVGVSAAPSM